jgi:hypothetical protein
MNKGHDEKRQIKQKETQANIAFKQIKGHLTEAGHAAIHNMVGNGKQQIPDSE